MLREILEDAICRGEKLKKDIVRQVLSAAALNDLINNKRFAHSIARVIRTKHEISHLLRRNVQDILRMMSIPSREQISAYERRVQRLEGQIDRLGRQLMKKGNARRARPARKRPH